MKHVTDVEQPDKPILGACPVCGSMIPIFTVKIQHYGLFKLRTQVTIDGDATDWVAHLWSHRGV